MSHANLYAHHLSTVRLALSTIRDLRSYTYLSNLAYELKSTGDIETLCPNLIVDAIAELDGLQGKASKRGHVRIAARLRDAVHALHTAALYNPGYQVWDGDRYAVCESHATRWTVRNGHGLYWIVVGSEESYSVIADGKRVDDGSEEGTLAVYLVRQAKANAQELAH